LKCGVAVGEYVIMENECGFSYCCAVFSDYKTLSEIVKAITEY
jgi:hypothetical protein